MFGKLKRYSLASNVFLLYTYGKGDMMNNYKLRNLIFLTLCCDMGLFSKRLIAPVANIVTDMLMSISSFLARAHALSYSTIRGIT